MPPSRICVASAAWPWRSACTCRGESRRRLSQTSSRPRHITIGTIHITVIIVTMIIVIILSLLSLLSSFY